MNKFAITSAGIGDALQRSASALFEGGNTLDEAIALITTANQVVQNPEVVGTAMKTLSLRLRSAKVDLESAGEDVDGMAESVSDLQKKLLALTGGKVDIMIDKDTFKSTTQILREMSSVWGEMTDANRSAALDLMGGKRQANTLAAIIKDFQTVEKVIETSSNSAGSALKENEVYLDSMQGRIDKLTNSMQSMWVNAMDSTILKGLISIVDVLVQIVDKAGLANVAIAALMGRIAFNSKHFGVLNWFNNKKNGKTTMSATAVQDTEESKAQDADTAATERNTAAINANIEAEQRSAQASAQSAAEDIKEAQAATQVATAEMAEVSSTQREIVEDTKEAMASNAAAAADKVEAVGGAATGATAGVNALTGGLVAGTTAFKLFNAAATMGLSLLAGLVMQGLAKLADDFITTSEELKEAAKQAMDTYKNAQSTLSSTRSTIKEISADYRVLAAGVDEFGNNINLNTSQYERYNEIVNQIADMFPEMVRGYTAEGNAIIKNKGNVEALTSAYKALQDEANNTLLSKADDIMGNYKTTFSGKWYENGPDTDALKIKAARELEKMLKNQDTYDYSWMSDTNQYSGRINTVVKLLEDAGIEDKSFFESAADYTKRAISEYPRIVQSIVNTWESTVNAAVSNVKPLVSAYLDNSSVGYAGLTSEQKSTIDSVVSSFDEEFFNQFDGDASKMYNAIESLIQNIKTAGIDGEYALVLNTKTQFNNNDISVGDYQARIQEFITQIDDLQKSGLLSENDAKYIKISLGFEFDDNGNIQDDVDSMLNHAKSVIDTSKETIENELKRLGEGGTVDLLVRPKVKASIANTKDWQLEEGDIATVLTNTFSNEDGTIAMNFTPILTDENGKYKDMLTPDELQIYAEEVIAGVREDDLNLKIGATYEGSDAIEQAERDARTIHELHDMYFLENNEIPFDKLSYSDLRIINSDQFNVDGSVIASWEQLQYEIKQTKIAMTEDFTVSNFADYADSISALQENISAYQEALEKLESGSFTMSDFVELIEKFPDLAKGVDTSSKSFKGLSTNLKKAIRSSPKSLIKDLKNLKQQLIDAGKSTDDIDNLINAMEELPVDTVQSLSDEYITLADAINGAKIAQNELKDAMSENPNEGFETRAEAMEYMKEALSRGEIGSESNVWNVAEQYGFTYDSAKSINENADALANFITVRNKWYAKDDDGNYSYEGTENFINAVEQAVAKSSELQKYMSWTYEDGVLSFDFDNANWDKIISYLRQTEELAGITSEEFYDLLMQIGQFHNINWQDSDDLLWYLNQLKDGTKSISENFDSAKNAIQSFLENNDISLSWLDEDIKIVDTDSFRKLPEEIQKVLTEYYDLKAKFEADPLGIKFQLDKNSSDKVTKESLETLSQLTTVLQDNGTGTVFIDYTHLKEAAKEAGYTEEAIDGIIDKIKEYNNVCGIERAADDPLGLIGLQENAKMTEQYLTALQVKFESIQNADNTVSFKIETESLIDALIAQGWTSEGIQSYLTTLESSGTYSFTIDGAEVKLSTEDAQSKINQLIEDKQAMSNGETTQYTVTGPGEASVDHIKAVWDSIPITKSTSYSIYETTYKNTVDNGVDANGTAHASGNWGTPRTETALVGELGPELVVDPKSSSWYTVGDTGAEFTTIPKGSIIFNHKQTEQLLKNGYVTGRGKAHAAGTAYVSGGSTHKKYSFDDTSGSERKGSSSSSADDAKDQFEELFDWIEVRLEEINKQLDFKNARLENSVGYSKQNKVIDEMLDLNEKLYDNLIAGANKYYEYAGTLLAKIPAQYRQAAQDGSIAIETFIGEVDEETYNAIQEFREWVQKGDDAVQQAEEAITEASSLAKQAIDNIGTDFGNKNSLRDSKIDQLDAYNALTEAKYGAESEAIYKAIIKETNKNIKTLETQRDKMQAELDKQVREGNIQKYSQDWYDAVNEIAAVDTEIINLTKDTYDYQDSINDLHWDTFDNILSRLEAISDEADSLIDILGEKDLINKDTAKWTNEGITALGLYAQKMEVAEMQAKKYKDEINYLNKNWKKLGYTEQEYVEKLEELKEDQYDSIKAYEDTKKAIVDLNKERIDAIKSGIEREIEAYEKLINKKKEELDADKD